jgi:putative membrane protein
MSNAVFATLFAPVFFLLFITPVGGWMRLSPLSQGMLTLLMPVIGLIMVLPMDVKHRKRATYFMTCEVLLAFATLVFDAIPGILIRINESVLDEIGVVPGVQPDWFPSPLRDQQLSGEILWVVAEVADLPILLVSL